MTTFFFRFGPSWDFQALYKLLWETFGFHHWLQDLSKIGPFSFLKKIVASTAISSFSVVTAISAIRISSWLIYGNAVARVDCEASAGLATAARPSPFLEIRPELFDIWGCPRISYSAPKTRWWFVMVCHDFSCLIMVDHMVIHSPWWFIIVYHHFPGFLKSDIAVLTSSPCGSRPHRNTWEPLGSPHHCRTPRCSACGNGICDWFSIRMKRLVSPLALLAPRFWISGAWSW